MLPDRRPPRTPRLTPLPVDSGPLSIAVVGPSRFGIAEPFAGGLEAHTAGLVRRLHSLGHRLTVAAGPERCANDLPVRLRPIVSNDFDHLFTGRRDISPPAEFLAHETERYQVLVDDLVGRRDIDVIHNNSLHPAMVDADPARVAIVHVLHCPPTPELWAAHVRLAERDGDRRVIAVSASVAAAWKGLATDTVLNGVDTSSWHPTAAGHSGAVWAGRIVPEKAPHLAIRACRLAGIPLTLAGPVGDESYFRRFVERELVGPVEWVGPLDSCELAGAVCVVRSGRGVARVGRALRIGGGRDARVGDSGRRIRSGWAERVPVQERGRPGEPRRRGVARRCDQTRTWTRPGQCSRARCGRTVRRSDGVSLPRDTPRADRRCGEVECVGSGSLRRCLLTDHAVDVTADRDQVLIANTAPPSTR